MIATILVNTGSRVDDIIFEEFKGTANMTLWLDTPEENEPMFPVIDMRKVRHQTGGYAPGPAGRSKA